MIGLGLYDSEENARKVDEIMDQGPPAAMPEELRASVPKRTFAGIFEVIQRDGA
jgi:hypothetical protein